MAISYVGGQSAGRAGTTTQLLVNFSFTPQSGDLVVVTLVVGSQGRNPTLDLTAQGYTNLTQLNPNATTQDTSLCVCYKFMGGTPDTSVTMPSTGNNQDAQSWSIQCFRGVDSSSPMDVTPVSATGTATGRPNPGSITPVTAGAWVVICGGGCAGTGATYTAPANFTTNFLTSSQVDTNDSMVGSGYWSGWTSGAVDPAQYTGGTTNATDSWAAYTLALRPSLATLVADPATFALTAAAATLQRALNINAEAATYVESGADATLSRGYTMNATPGSFVISGSAAAATADRAINASDGGFAITGISARLGRDITQQAYPGSCLYSGADATLAYSGFVAPGAVLWDTFVWDNFYWDRAQLDTEVGAFSLSGFTATLSKGFTLNAEPGVFNLSGNDATLLRSYSLPAASGSLSLSGTDATIAATRTMNASPGNYALTGQANTMTVGRGFNALPAVYAMAGFQSSLTRNLNLLASAGSYAISGAAATLYRGLAINAGPSAYSLQGANANLVRTYGLAASTNAYSLSGQPSQMMAGRNLNASAGGIALTGIDTGFVITRALVAEPAAFVVNAPDASLDYSGAEPANDDYAIARFRARR
jgi:hypothetical protein